MMRLCAREDERKQKTERLGGLLLLALAMFYALICTPVYILSSTNIMISTTAFPIIWDFVQYLVQFSYFWIAFAFVIYLSVRYSMKDAKMLLLIFAGCSAGRYFLSLLVGYAMLAGSSGWDALSSDLLYMLLDILGDWLQMGLAVLLVYLFVMRKKKSDQAISLHFPSLLCFSSPVLLCVLCVSFLPSISSLLSRVNYDLFFGAPQSAADLLWMIFYYCGDVLSGVIGYLVIFLLITQLYLKDEEAKLRDKQTLSGDHF